MTKACEVKGRPPWSRDEPLEVQRFVVEHRLTSTQLRALRQYADDPGAAHRLSYSTARALMTRGWGEIAGSKIAPPLSRDHPRAKFVLNDAGKAALIRATRVEEGTDERRRGHRA